MAHEEMQEKIQGLGDLDLALLLCLTSREHCIISTEPDALGDLVEELQLVASQTFNLRSAVIDCGPQTTLDDFAASILLSPPSGAAVPSRSNSPVLTRSGADAADSYFLSSTYSARRGLSGLPPQQQQQQHQQQQQQQAGPAMANVVLARDLDRAPKAVQIQALELLRTRRIFTRTSVQAAPKQFLFVAVLAAASGGAARVTDHLNDFFYMAHWHDPLDGFAHRDELDAVAVAAAAASAAAVETDSSLASGDSVVRRSRAGTPSPGAAQVGVEDRVHFSESEIATLAAMSRQVSVDVEVLRYQMNIVSFLRMHRAVAGGVVPLATKHFDQLVRCLATLHGLDYVTPSLVVLAAKKIYMHRLRIVRPEQERSMQWGSQLAAVRALLDGVGPEDVIEDVVAMVATPL